MLNEQEDKKNKDYGIKEYTEEQLAFHKDIMNILKKKEHLDIPADDCLVVFGRVYSTYILSQLVKNGKIKNIKKGEN